MRTDKPEAELGIYENSKPCAAFKWQAHRQLAETLHTRIKSLLEECHKDLNSLDAIIVYKGPGSFTGLRIGISAANAYAYALGIVVVGSTGEDWIQRGHLDLNKTKNNLAKPVLPMYGEPVHITLPKT